ncbi:protein kinase [Mycobacterium sp. Marseille-P9652]|uniref:protein kinase n=1 Tax=Mycobacterium sp. Marseille-P9652 TaxID=2654950 RepID=UPI0012E9505F|nr:protein kinase [Mycobacterium sp. Marseille-P9652]
MSTDLRTVLARGPMEPARAVDLVCQIAAAIDHLHATESLHREVTTATILLSDDGRAYLADPRAFPSPQQRSPEGMRNSEASYRADIYALAGVLYECLTGFPPMPIVVPPSQRRPGIPPEFDRVIARGMAPNPGERYGSAAELADAARHALATAHHDGPSNRLTRPSAPGGYPSHGHAEWQPLPSPVARPRRRRRVLIAVLAVVAVALIGTAAAVAVPRLTRHSDTTPSQHTYTAAPTPLPFPDLNQAQSIAVDAAGGVYVLGSLTPGVAEGDLGTRRLFTLPPSATSPTAKTVPGIDFRLASDMATDGAGNLYLCDGTSVWELAPGAPSPIRLPFRGFVNIQAIAVDAAGTAYAAGDEAGGGLDVKYGVKRLAPGDTRSTDLPFADVDLPRAVAVDKAGTVYLGDTIRGTGKGRVRKLVANADTPTALSFPGLLEASRFAIDSAGNLFVADAWQKTAGLFELPAGGTTATKVPVSERASTVAVDSADNLYIAENATLDRNNRIVRPGQVLKFAPDR